MIKLTFTPADVRLQTRDWIPSSLYLMKGILPLIMVISDFGFAKTIMPDAVKNNTRSAQAIHAAQASQGASHQEIAPSLSNIESLESLEAATAKLKNITAQFQQVTTSAMSGRSKESAGRVYVSKPKSFRWEVISPDPSILTSNGIRIWYYTPPFQEGDRGQLLVRAAKKDQTQLAISLLAGGESLKKQFDVRKLSSSKERVASYRLIPLKEAGSIKDVELQIENQTNLVYRVTLNHFDGGRTQIRFTEISKVASLPAQMFHFTAPPGVPVDVVDESK